MKEHCREMLQRAYLFLDGESLTVVEKHEMRQHLEDCAPCYERYGLEAEFKALMARLRGCNRCPDSLRDKIKTLLEEA